MTSSQSLFTHLLKKKNTVLVIIAGAFGILIQDCDLCSHSYV